MLYLSVLWQLFGAFKRGFLIQTLSFCLFTILIQNFNLDWRNGLFKLVALRGVELGKLDAILSLIELTEVQAHFLVKADSLDIVGADL